MKTFWVVPNAKASSQSAASDDSAVSDIDDFYGAKDEMRSQPLMKHEREIDWVSELLSGHIKNIVAKRELLKAQSKSAIPAYEKVGSCIPLEDIVDSIHLPEACDKMDQIDNTAKQIKLPPKIQSLLRQYVSIVSIHQIVL